MLHRAESCRAPPAGEARRNTIKCPQSLEHKSSHPRIRVDHPWNIHPPSSNRANNNAPEWRRGKNGYPRRWRNMHKLATDRIQSSTRVSLLLPRQWRDHINDACTAAKSHDKHYSCKRTQKKAAPTPDTHTSPSPNHIGELPSTVQQHWPGEGANPVNPRQAQEHFRQCAENAPLHPTPPAAPKRLHGSDGQFSSSYWRGEESHLLRPC